MNNHIIGNTHTIKLVGFVALSAMFASSSSLAQSTEVTVDNRDANTNQVGYWWPSSGPNPYLGDSLYNQNRDGIFTWYPVLPEAGDYDVYAWWTYHENRSTTVPYRINHVGGTDSVFVNQRDPALGGQWNILGTFTFSAGVTPEISVMGTQGNASADAVRFVATGSSISIKPRLKVIEVRERYTQILGTNTTTGLVAACPEGTLLTGGGARQNRYSNPPPATETFELFAGSSGLENMWIAEFYNPSDSTAVTLYVEVYAICATIETD